MAPSASEANVSDKEKVVVNESGSQPSGASTPPLPWSSFHFPAERLVGGHEKMNFFDFAMAFPFAGFAAFENGHYGRLQTLAEQNVSDAQKFSDKIRTDAQNLAVKITTDAATHVKTLDAAVEGAIQTGLTLNQQNIGPATQEAGQNLAGGVAPANRVTDALQNLGLGSTTVAIPTLMAMAIAQGQLALAALVPVVVTASGGASTPSQTTTKPSNQPTAA